MLEIVVIVPRSAPFNWIELDGCLAGPDTDTALAQVRAMLTSVVWMD